MDPDDGVHGRPADRGRLAVRDHPDVADEQQPHDRPRLRSRRRAVRRRLRRIELRDHQREQLGPASSPTSAAPDTPGPDPQFVAPANQASTTFSFNIGKSGGVSYKWEFSDGGTATGANVTHTYLSAGNGDQADGHADRHLRRRRDGREDDRRPGPDDGADRGHRRRGQDARVHARAGRPLRRVRAGRRPTTTPRAWRRTSSRRCPNATLSVVDPSTASPGRLVNTGTPLRERTARAGDQRGQPEHRVREHLGESVDAADLVRTRSPTTR